MEEKIPKNEPVKNEDIFFKPLETLSDSSMKGNKYIFNDEINNNQNIFDENEYIQGLNKDYSNYLIQEFNNKNKNKKNLKSNIQSLNTGVNVNIIEGVIQKKDKKKNKELENKSRTNPYNFKYFSNIANKKSINQALSNKNNKNDNKELESNFIKLSKEANIYTSNAEYISNQKMLLFDKYDFENNKYKPNRAKLFDMTSIPKRKNLMTNTLYKTTKFRGGRMYLFDNKSKPKILDNIIKEDLKEKKYINKKPLYLQDIEKYEIKKDKIIRKKDKQTQYIDNTFQKHKRHPPSNTLYKELMTKKNEIYDNFMKRIGSGQEMTEPIIQAQITFPTGFFEEEKIKKNKNNNLNGFSGLLSKKKNDGIIPITYPLICSNMLKCDSMSQRARYENIMDTFIKLKSMIDNDKNFGKLNEKQYIIDFISNKNIEKKYFNEKNYENFHNFLYSKKMPIDNNKSLKENIIIALNYNDEEYNKNNNINLQNNENEKNNTYKQRIILNDKQFYFNKPKFILTDTNIFNNKPLEYDIPRQKKLLKEVNYKTDFDLRDSLEKELLFIEDEVENQQDKINKVEEKLNLLPFETDYYYKHNLQLQQNKKEIKKDLRLISQKEFNKINAEKNKNNKKNNNKYNLYDCNERLYYTWYKNNNFGDIKNYKKKTKLTEYIIYNRTKEKIIDEKIEEIAEKKGIKMKELVMTP